MAALTRMTYGVLAAAYRTRSARVVTVTVVPPAPPVVPAAKPSAVLDQVRPDGVVGGVVPPTWLNASCIRATSEHVSWMIGLLPAVELSLSLTHNPVATLAARYLPGAADDAAKVHCWLTFVPSPHPHCCSCRPD